MEFKEKYCPVSEKEKPENKNKKVLSEEGYAMCELLDAIKKQLFRGVRR